MKMSLSRFFTCFTTRMRLALGNSSLAYKWATTLLLDSMRMVWSSICTSHCDIE